MIQRVRALMIVQNERPLLMFSIPAGDLRALAYFNEREFDRESGIQRQFKPERSMAIAEYIDSEDAVLANNIVVNLELRAMGLRLKDVYDARTEELALSKLAECANERKGKLAGKAAFVVDGQHRLRAFEHTLKKDFPLVVTAMTNLSLAEVAELFVKINYYQKPVNKSLVYDLLGISEDIFPEYYELHHAVVRLNTDVKSPFYDRIKMLGVGRGIISQAGVIGALDLYKVPDAMRQYGLQPNRDEVYGVTWNFFTAAAAHFADEWQERRLFGRTLGIRALVRLMAYTLALFSKQGRHFDQPALAVLLGRLAPEYFSFERFGSLGGEKGVGQLFREMRDKLQEG